MTALEFLSMISGSCMDINADKLPQTLNNLMADIPPKTDIKRNNAAAVLHVYLRDSLGYKDITNDTELKKAYLLKDIYDCRRCVNDIAQVYVRGLMEAKYDIFEQKMHLFGTMDILTMEEALKIKERLTRYIQK